MVNYANRGFIKIEGKVTVSGDVEKLITEWSQKASMPVDDANIIHNVIMSNCLPTALLVARDVKLPPPFPMPRVNIQKKGDRSASDGMEVA